MSEAGEPRVERVVVGICNLCLDGTGGECHVPGCVFCFKDAPEVSIRDLTEPFEPSVAVERVRQPLTAILGRLDLAIATIEGEPMAFLARPDVSAAREAAWELRHMCEEACR